MQGPLLPPWQNQKAKGLYEWRQPFAHGWGGHRLWNVFAWGCCSSDDGGYFKSLDCCGITVLALGSSAGERNPVLLLGSSFQCRSAAQSIARSMPDDALRRVFLSQVCLEKHCKKDARRSLAKVFSLQF